MTQNFRKTGKPCADREMRESLRGIDNVALTSSCRPYGEGMTLKHLCVSRQPRQLHRFMTKLKERTSNLEMHLSQIKWETLYEIG